MRYLLLLASFCALFSCSGLKLSKDSNCLNEKSACFKNDITPPKFVRSVNPADGATISVLSKIEIMFSEELNNPQPSDFQFSEAGMSIISVKKLNDYSYELLTNRNPTQGGTLTLSFPTLKDYNGNKITNSSTSYNIDIGIPVITSVDRYGMSDLSAGTGYPSVNVTWHHTYTPELTGITTYSVKVTSGSPDCKGPGTTTILQTSINPLTVGGSTLPADLPKYNAADINNTSFKFRLLPSITGLVAVGTYTVLVCVENVSNNKYGTGTINIFRANNKPVTAISPPSGFYGAPRTMTMTCSPYPDKIAYDLRTIAGAGLPTFGSITPLPGFDTGTGAITSGYFYDNNNKPQNPYTSDPTNTRYAVRCIDMAGNIEDPQDTNVYQIDGTYPVVTLSKIYKSGTTVDITGVSGAVGAYNPADVLWSTNQVGKYYEFRLDNSCGSAGFIAFGTTPGTANAMNTTPVAHDISSHVMPLSDNQITICVGNNTTAGTSTNWGREFFNLVHDDSAPTAPTVNISAGSYGAQQDLIFSCNNNQDRLAYIMATQLGSTAPAVPAQNPGFDSNGLLDTAIGGNTAFTGPLRTPDASSTLYKVICIDRAGNKSPVMTTAAYNIDSILPTVTIASTSLDYVSNVAGYDSTIITWRSSRGNLPFEFRLGSTDCTDGSVIGGLTTLVGGSPVTQTPSDVNQQIATTIPSSALATNGNTVHICVKNLINRPGYTSKIITKDIAQPVIAAPAASPSILATSATDFTVNWTAATDNNSVAFYRIFRSTTSNSYPTTPDYTTASTSISITMPDTQKYYLRIVPVDIAGNVAGGAIPYYNELSTKPDIRLIISNLSGTVKINDGAQGDQSFSGNIIAPGNLWTTPLVMGGTYFFTVTQQPTGQVCSIKEKQFGVISGDVTITVNCASGQMVGGRYQAIPGAPMNYMMYRGNVTTPYIGSVNINGVVIISGTMYFAQRDTAATSSVWKCNPASCSGSLTAVVNPTTAVFRHMATDGTNLYVADGTLATARVHKYSAIDTAQTTPAAIYDLGTAPATGFASGVTLDVSRNMLYAGMRNLAEIRRLRLDTGAVATLTSVVSQHEGLAFLGDDLYVATPDNGNCILKATNAHIATSASLYAGSCGTTEDYVDGTLLNARFARPHGLITDGTDLYVGEFTGRRIRRINVRKGIISTITGGISGTVDGTGVAASFNSPFSMATEGRALYLADSGATRIRKIIDGGLQGYWPVATGSPELNYSGSSSAVATSLNGTLSSTTTDRYGTPTTAPQFTGAQYVASASGQVALTATCDITLAAWYRNDSLGTTQGIVYNGNSSTSGYGILFIPGDGIKILAGTVGWLPGTGGVKSYMPNAGEWTHVAARCRGSNIWTLFINGKKYLEMPLTPNAPSAAGAQLLFGRESTSAFLNGAVADVRAYNRPLNEGEIQELAQDASSSAAVTGIGFSKSATGLLSHYEIFNGVLSDSGALNYQITSGSGALVNGKDGDPSGAYSFNISLSQYLATANNTLDGTGNGGEITVAAWVSPATLPPPGAVNIIASRYSAADTTHGYYLEYFNNAGTQQLYWASSGGVSSYTTNITMPLNTWSHVAVTHSGTTATIYVNGQAMPTTQVSPRPLSPTTNATPIYIGHRDDGNNTNGKIDDVRIYNKALNAWQIRELATQIPHGLVGRYDFTGDRSDISGYGQDLSNNGVTLTTDRFGMASSAALFNGSANFSGTMANYPLGNSPRTICAWTRPSNLINGTFSEAVMYGTNGSGTGWGFGMDAAGGLPNGRLFILNTVADTIYTRPHGLNIWRHVCATYNGSIEQLLLDGTVIATRNSLTLSTASGSLVIGRGIFGSSDYFNGSIDDVRIYNRVLSPTEIQTLQQQPNRRIFVTAATPTGNLGGIAGADSICAGDANKPVTPNVFKAMLVDNSVRIACLGSDCPSGGIPESTDWVLRPNITYTRADMTTPIFTANFQAIFVFGNFTNPVATSAGNVWTGMIPQWATDSSTADNWTNAGSNGVYGDRSATNQAAIYSFWGTGNASLYCVEQ